jgi:hypothetical protein
VDFWTRHVGGHDDFITALVGALPTHSELVALDHQLEED